jgi:hypothetical protein
VTVHCSQRIAFHCHHKQVFLPVLKLFVLPDRPLTPNLVSIGFQTQITILTPTFEQLRFDTRRLVSMDFDGLSPLTTAFVLPTLFSAFRIFSTTRNANNIMIIRISAVFGNGSDANERICRTYRCQAATSSSLGQQFPLFSITCHRHYSCFDFNRLTSLSAPKSHHRRSAYRRFTGKSTARFGTSHRVVRARADSLATSTLYKPLISVYP